MANRFQALMVLTSSVRSTSSAGVNNKVLARFSRPQLDHAELALKLSYFHAAVSKPAQDANIRDPELEIRTGLAACSAARIVLEASSAEASLRTT